MSSLPLPPIPVLCKFGSIKPGSAINNLSTIKINLPYISNEIKKDYEKHYCDLIDYYNKELEKFSEKLKEYNVSIN